MRQLAHTTYQNMRTKTGKRNNQNFLHPHNKLSFVPDDDEFENLVHMKLTMPPMQQHPNIEIKTKPMTQAVFNRK